VSIQASTSSTPPTPPTPPSLAYSKPREHLLRTLIILALPVLAENFLGIVVGLNDTYLANHLPERIRVDGTAAVGTVLYLLWFINLFAGALGTGATAIISRAIGARHRARAHACCGQAVLFAAVLGLAIAVFFLAAAPLIATLAGLKGEASHLFIVYLRLLAIGTPFMVVLMVANACLRGAGDTRTPFLAMCIINTVNVALTWSLTLGVPALHIPALDIAGIAIGTSAAYVVGGVMQTFVLIHGVGKLKLRMHRLRFHHVEMKRLLRIGLPSAGENSLMWIVNFFLIHAINVLGTTAAAAHLNAVRIEALSFMTGWAVATATATLVGQSLGMKDIHRARRSAHLGYLVGGVAMACVGLSFILFNHTFADIISDDPNVRTFTAGCLFITGFIQPFFAAAIIFGAALRGAGDTGAVMLLNFLSLFGIRLAGVYFVCYVLHGNLWTIWYVLCGELVIRGSLMYLRLAQGGWTKIAV
jgi:putative MATE family efflux protein